MKSTKKINKEEIELNRDNLPDNRVPNKSKVYMEKSFFNSFLGTTPDWGFQQVKKLFAMAVIFQISLIISKSMFSDFEQTLLIEEIYNLLTPYLPGILILVGIPVMLLSVLNTGRSKVYIISEDSVISTVDGREEIDSDNVEKINLENISDIKFESDSVVFVSEQNEIKIDNLDKEEVENIQNYLIFNSQD